MFPILDTNLWNKPNSNSRKKLVDSYFVVSKFVKLSDVFQNHLSKADFPERR